MQVEYKMGDGRTLESGPIPGGEIQEEELREFLLN